MVSHKSKLIKKINLNLSKYGSCSSDFDLNQDLASSQKLKFLEASVLIPVLTFKEDLEILLTKRSLNLRNTTLQWGEVDEVFTIPFSHILNIKNFAIETRKWNGIERRYYIVPFGPYYIWGATARILLNFSKALI